MPFLISIVGGGISGLAAAYFLEQLCPGEDIEISLFEGERRLGGVILTENSDGFVLEAGPDSFIAQKPQALELCRRLGLESELLPSNDHLRRTYVLRRGSLRELPPGLQFIVPTRILPLLKSQLLSPAGKLRLCMEPFLPGRRYSGDGDDESAADFIRRRFGQEALDYIAEPLLAGIYGGDAQALSARSVLPRLVYLEQKYGSVTRGILTEKKLSLRREGKSRSPESALFVSLKGGMRRLIEALAAALGHTRVFLGRKAVGLRKGERNGRIVYRLLLEDGSSVEADALVLAVPAHAAAAILRELDGALAGLLGQIPYASAVTVSLAYQRSEFKHPLHGFGFLVPKVEGKRLLACTWTSSKFDHRCPDSFVLLRCFLGGARGGLEACADEAEIVRTVRRELGEIMKIDCAPEFARVFRWRDAMPQYTIDHQVRLRTIASLLAKHKGVCLAGNAYGGVGIPDCIASAGAAASSVASYIRENS